MEHKQTFRKSVAWAIFLSMLNPAYMVPAAYARDTDIYTSVQTSAQTAEPDILVILDTSDSMNLPEAWREYSGAYDSHVEYLWNDPTYFASIVLPPALPNPPAWPTTDYGTWGGAGVPPGGTTVERTALRTNATNWMNATQAGDPGARNVYRNYGGGRGSAYSNANWVYWLPAGTAMTDLRLLAPSFNRSAIGVANIAGTRGGIVFPAVSDYRTYNKCTDSLISATMDPVDTTLPMGLMPSTVYAPTTYARNSGKYLNQQWQRWERWLRLGTQNFNSYGQFAGDFAASGFPGAAAYAAGYIAAAATANAKQDNVGGILSANQQPIRQRINAGNPSTVQSYAGWTNLQADMGGYAYQAYVQGLGAAVLGNVITQYAPASTATLDNYRKAYLGNRDRTGPAPTNDKAFGTPAYYDNLPAACNPVTGPASATCVLVASGGSAGTPYSQTTTRYCTISPANSSGVDSANATIRYGGSCVLDTATYPALTEPPAAYAAPAGYRCTGNGPSAAVPSTVAGVPPYYYPCPSPASGPTPVGASQGGPPPVCTFSSSPATYASTTYANCNWKNRSAVHVEGVGDFWVNGSCTGDKYTSTGGASRTLASTNDPTNCNVTAAALPAGAITTTLNSIAYNFVINQANGGGTGTTNQCGNKAPINTNCNTLPGSPATCNNGTCNNQIATATNTIGVVGVTNTYYTVLPQLANDPYLNHDCRADDPDNLNLNSPVGYMTNQTDGATWNLSWAVTVAATNQPYTSAAGRKITTAPNIDMYSVNYLNWKWGPHSNGNPIGRKTRLQIAKDALSTLVDTTNGVRFGLEVFNRTKTDYTNTGGNIAFKIKRTGTTDIADPAFGTAPNNAALLNRAPIKTAINGLVAAARTPLTESLYEAYLYFRGETPWSGTRTGAAVVGGVENAGNNNADSGIPLASGAVCSALSPAGTCPQGIGKYESPMMSNPNPPGLPLGSPTPGPAACQKNFVLLITDGGPEDDGGANTLITALTYTTAAPTTYSPDTTVDTYQPDTGTKQFETAPATPYGPTDLAGSAEDPSSNGYVWLDELAWFMSRGDMNANLTGAQPVITYTIGFAGANSPVLQNAAAVSGGTYYIADDSAGLATALASAIAAIRQWNPSASTPTVPISALNRTENSSDVFLAFFGPTGLTNWDGTVKKFHLGPTPVAGVRPPPPNECMDDQGVNPAVCLMGQTTLFPAGTRNIEQTDTTSGAPITVVNDSAVSYWTPLLGAIPSPIGGNYPLLDGGKPTIGGTGHQLVTNGTPAARKMYTHLSTSASADLTAAVNAMKDTNAAITGTVLGNAGLSAAQRATLINWARGANTSDPTCNDAADDGSTACASFRSWAHAAVLHSKPAVVNYGANNQTVYYISTDGVLHAVDAIDTVGSGGKERWSFMIEEALPQLNTLMTNLAGNQLAVADGSPVVYVDDVNKNGYVDAGEKAWLYFGLRRGGSAYYALDVTNRDAPVMMWKITPTQLCTGTSCGPADPSFLQMADTWSTPAAVKLRAMPAGIPAVIFGGGYDTNQDLPIPAPMDPKGKALFVVNGSDGSLVKAFATGSNSMPSDPAALDMDSDTQHYVDRIYIGDMGGGVWRFDVNGAVAAWGAHKIAQLTSGASGKIFFPPVVVKQFFDGERFDAVYVGTGDKEHPLLLGTMDKMFMIKDTYTGFVSSQGGPYNYPGAFLDVSAGTAFDTVTLAAPQLVQFHASHGWYYSLASSEKVSSSAEVVYNVLNFGTYTPTASLNACLPPGLGQLYGLNAIFAGKADTNFVGGVTMADPPTYGSVGIKGRGFVSPGGIIVIGGVVYRVTVVDGALKTIRAGQLLQQRVYWQREPEL